MKTLVLHGFGKLGDSHLHGTVKSPELLYKNGEKPVHKDLERDDDWFYMI